MEDLPRLETARLTLRVPGPDDARALAEFAGANREHFRPWDPARREDYFTAEHWRGQLAETVRQAAAGTTYQFVMNPAEGPPGTILGQCTVSGIARGPFQAAYLGYGLDREAVGKGLMAEALRAVIGFCFGELGLHRLMANHMPENVRSARLLRSLGFVPEGYARDYLLLDGRWRDHVLTALVNPDWDPTGMATPRPRP